VTVTTFASALGLSPRTVRGWCQRGLLEGAWNVGGGTMWLIPRATLEHYAGMAAGAADMTDPADQPPEPRAATE